MAGEKNIPISPEQRTRLMCKIRENAVAILSVVENAIGVPLETSQTDHGYYGKYVFYAMITHAVEEFGKLLYVGGLSPDEDGRYNVQYRGPNGSHGAFLDHRHKFSLAIDDLKSIIPAYKKLVDEDVSGSEYITKLPNWDSRLTILNVDIDSAGEVKEFNAKLEMGDLIKNVSKIRERLQRFKIPDT